MINFVQKLLWQTRVEFSFRKCHSFHIFFCLLSHILLIFILWIGDLAKLNLVLSKPSIYPTPYWSIHNFLLLPFKMHIHIHCVMYENVRIPYMPIYFELYTRINVDTWKNGIWAQNQKKKKWCWFYSFSASPILLFHFSRHKFYFIFIFSYFYFSIFIFFSSSFRFVLILFYVLQRNV